MSDPHPWRTLRAWLTLRPWTRHSLVLLVGGLVYGGIGTNAMFSAKDLSPRQTVALEQALRMWPLEAWGLLFIMSGVLAIFSSRWPAFVDAWGYAVLTSISGAWSAVYFFGIIFGSASETNVVYGVVWALIAFMWWAISGLVNPSPTTVYIVEEVVDEP